MAAVTVTGTPEVAGTLEFSADVNLEGWYSTTSVRLVPKLPTPTDFVNRDTYWEPWNIKSGKSNYANSIDIDKFPDWMDRPTKVTWETTRNDDPVKVWSSQAGNNLQERLFEYEGQWYFSIPIVYNLTNYVRIYRLCDETLQSKKPVVYEMEELAVKGSYIPLVVTVGDTAFSGLDYADAESFEEAIEAAVAEYGVEFEPGEDLSEVSVPTITWEWPFSSGDENDAKDTELGNLETAPTIAINFTVTATQVD